jgi:hypothetical protein
MNPRRDTLVLAVATASWLAVLFVAIPMLAAVIAATPQARALKINPATVDLFWQVAPIILLIAWLSYCALCLVFLNTQERLIQIPEGHRPRWPSVNLLDGARMVSFLFVSRPQNAAAKAMLGAARVALFVQIAVGLTMLLVNDLAFGWGFNLLPR